MRGGLHHFSVFIGPLRERRRTISERSSTVSDITYTSDLDMEDAIEPLSEDEPVNGCSENRNGDAEESEIVVLLLRCLLTIPFIECC